MPGLCNFMRTIICLKIWEYVVGHYRLHLESLTKIGHNNAFRLLLLHCFKIRNISSTLACMTGKYFRKSWLDWGCFQLIWGHLGLFTVIFKACSRSIRNISAPLTSSITIENLISFETIFLMNLIYTYPFKGDSP